MRKTRSISFLLLLIIAGMIIFSDISNSKYIVGVDIEVEDILDKFNKADEKAEYNSASVYFLKLMSMSNKLGGLYKVNDTQYLPVCDYLTQKISGWPEEARNKLVERIDTDLKIMYAKASAVEDFENIARLYAFCETGIVSHVRMAEIMFEEGDMGRVVFWLERAIKFGKLQPEKYPQIYAMLAYANAGLKDFSGAEKSLDSLSKIGAGKVKSYGVEYDVAQLIKAVTAAINAEKNGEKQELVGNNVQTYLVPQKPVVTIHSQSYYWRESTKEVYKVSGERSAIERKAFIKGDTLYFSNTKNVTAFDLKNNKKMWVYGIDEKTEAPDAVYNFGYMENSPEGTMNVFVSGNKIFANLGQYACNMITIRDAQNKPFPAINRVGKVDPATILHCITMGKGDPLWSSLNANPKELEFLNNIIFLNVPVAAQGSLFLTAVDTKKEPIEFLVCLDENTGLLKWKNNLWGMGEVEKNNRFRFGMMGQRRRKEGKVGPAMSDNPAPLSDGHSIYVSSHIGYLGAYSAASGMPLWVYEFESKPVTTHPTIRNSNKGWILNSPVICNNKVVFAPGDCEELLAFEKMTGKLAWKYPRGDNHYLLGVYNGNVILSGSKVTAIDAVTGKEAWSKEPDKDVKPFGRGCIYNGVIYIPTDKGLYIMDAKTGNVLNSLKWEDPWTQAGNVVISDGRLIICGYNDIIVYESVEEKRK